MAEAVNRVRKFSHDGGVDLWAVGEYERINRWLNAACEFFKHQMLVLHFSAEACGLEQSFPIPGQRAGVGGHNCNVIEQPFVDESDVAAGQNRRLIGFDGPVVLGVENAVDGSERNVFIAPAIARDEMRFQHFIVIGETAAVIGKEVGGGDESVLIDIGQRINTSVVNAVVIGVNVQICSLIFIRPILDSVVVEVHKPRRCVMGDVVQEGVVGAEGACRGEASGSALLEPVGGVGDAGVRVYAWRHHQLRVAIDAWDEFPVLIRQQQRHIADVKVAELDAQHGERLRFHLTPVADRSGGGA